MEQKKYWQSFGELNNSDAYQKSLQDEFQEELPFEDGKGLLDAATPRRDFLKYVGFSTAAAALAASCETPVRKAIPYVNKPAELTPGVANYYATTYISGGEAIPVVAKVRDGRPTKIEGNTLSSVTKGGTSARVQASVLDLYDTARLRFPLANGKEVSSLEAFDKMVMSELAGGQVVLLTSTINAPTSKQIISEFLVKYPGSRHVQYDAVSYSGMLLANEACYGKRVIPSYHFDKAKAIVSLGADFLGTWLNPVEFQKGYTAGRKVNAANPEMSKHIQFESLLSMTGANADDRYTHKPSETAAVAASLLAALTGGAVTVAGDKLKKGITKAAQALMAAKGNALVVSGSNDVNVQVLVNAINEVTGANGTTINWAETLQVKQGIDVEFNALVNEMNGGAVKTLIVYDANPAYDYFDAEKFKAALKKVRASISLNDRLDETTELCKYVLPANHYLESWGDAEPKTGYVSLLQPTIAPLFKTRQFQDTLLKWSGNTTSYQDYMKAYWVAKLGSENNFLKALQDGVIEPAAPSISGSAFNGARVAEATATSSKKGGRYEIALYQKVTMGDGKQANNPWLQETPDPITRMTWDNYIIVGPALGKEITGIDVLNPTESDTYDVTPKKPVAKVKVGNKEITLPVMILPGINPETIGIAVGYGRSEKSGRALKHADGSSVGKNAFSLATFNGNTIVWNADASIEKTSDTYKLAQTQTHASYEGRKEVIKEMTLTAYKAHPTEILDERAKELKPWGGLDSFQQAGTIYPTYDRPGIKWGMSIDLNSCYGCGACVVACTAENNVAVVGKSEVLRYHDMHWLRIDRYFTGDAADAESIQTVFQPMLCQHCDNAPCENVCPVAATNHSSEGLNQMTYNRCIGTRYCANNCPYKVRRFNWADYTGADSFGNNQVGEVDDSVLMMNDDLTRMVINPDVTVRSRGVIEKCSFCVQRLQEGKLNAKKEGRPLEDGDIKTACQQACAADAIVFGNANNANSAVSLARKDNKNRLFHSLEMTHVLPNVSYLAKIRNTEKLSPSIGQYVEKAEEETHEAAPHGAEHKEEAAH
jgi:MoCo/4Fe-4S cofactor protein with predicted Tat translocation signal